MPILEDVKEYVQRATSRRLARLDAGMQQRAFGGQSQSANRRIDLQAMFSF